MIIMCIVAKVIMKNNTDKSQILKLFHSTSQFTDAIVTVMSVVAHLRI